MIPHFRMSRSSQQDVPAGTCTVRYTHEMVNKNGGATRDRYLDAAGDYVVDNGMSELSLRPLAEAIGTSHRMLLYHFGSKEQLLVEIVREIERRERELVARSTPEDETRPDEVLRAFWKRISQPRYAARERLFFEIYGRALQGRDAT